MQEICVWAHIGKNIRWITHHYKFFDGCVVDDGVHLREVSPIRERWARINNPLKMTLSVPGICTVSAIVACKCTEIVVKMILACRARVELTRSALVHANELILSPWRLYVKWCKEARHANSIPRTTAMNSIVFCLLDSLVTSNDKAMAAYVFNSMFVRL